MQVVQKKVVLNLWVPFTGRPQVLYMCDIMLYGKLAMANGVITHKRPLDVPIWELLYPSPLVCLALFLYGRQRNVLASISSLGS